MALKYTNEQILKALQESKGMIYVAARQLKCSPNTIYNYAKKSAEIREAIQLERGLLVDVAELALWTAVQRGEAWAVSLALKTLGRDRGYVERIDLNVNIALVQETIKALEGAGIDATDFFTRAKAEAEIRRATAK